MDNHAVNTDIYKLSIFYAKGGIGKRMHYECMNWAVDMVI
jgi:hypothetical protein